MWTARWGKHGIACEKACKTTPIGVETIARESVGFLATISLAVDRLLIGRHESNPPSNNHYKESYKNLWKKAFKPKGRG
jgi:hypothetical protein